MKVSTLNKKVHRAKADALEKKYDEQLAKAQKGDLKAADAALETAKQLVKAKSAARGRKKKT